MSKEQVAAGEAEGAEAEGAEADEAEGAEGAGKGPSCETLAADQYGVFSLAQAKASGLHRSAIHRRVRSGAWQVAQPGVFRIAGAPTSFYQRLMTAVLWAGPDAVVSHQSAAALHGLDGFKPGLIEVSTTGKRTRPPPGMVCHRVKVLPPAHTGHVAGIPVTSADRMLLDLAGTLPADRLERALDEVLRLGLASRFRIAWSLQGARTRGHLVLASLLAVRLPGYAPPESELEALFFRLIGEAGLPLPRGQKTIDGTNLRVDYVWDEFPVAVETQGWKWHASRAAWQRDLTKRNLLTVQGYTVLQVTWEDLVQRPKETIQAITTVIERARLAPAPRPEVSVLSVPENATLSTVACPNPSGGRPARGECAQRAGKRDAQHSRSSKPRQEPGGGAVGVDNRGYGRSVGA